MWVISTLLGFYRQVIDASKELFIRILMGILIFLGYVLLSLFIYAVMRRIMVPQKLHTLPLHLQYDSKCLIHSSGRLSVCKYPHADLVLNNGKKLLSSGQYYSVILEIEMPETQVNLDIGMFMLNLTFYSTNKQFLSTTARPAMIHYKSSLLQVMYSIFYSIPLLLGFLEQKQMLQLVLFEKYYEPYGDGAISVVVSLENHRVHIYSTTLIINANFSGFTYYLYQWPVSMSIIVVICLLITLCTCTIILWLREVLNDYEARRETGIPRRRDMVVPRGRPMNNGRGAIRPGLVEHRQERQQPRPPLPSGNRVVETVGMASGRGAVVGAAGPGGGSTVVSLSSTTHPAGAHQPEPESTEGAQVEAASAGRHRAEPESAVESLDENTSMDTSVRTDKTNSSGSPTDTESDAGNTNTVFGGGAIGSDGDGLGEVIHSLQSLRQEMDSEDLSSSGTDMESSTERGLRRRTGN